MKAKRRRHEPEFKARVALEALKGIKTIQQIAKDFDVHPVQVSDWKKTMTEGAAGVFGPVSPSVAGRRRGHPPGSPAGLAVSLRSAPSQGRSPFPSWLQMALDASAGKPTGESSEAT